MNTKMPSEQVVLRNVERVWYETVHKLEERKEKGKLVIEANINQENRTVSLYIGEVYGEGKYKTYKNYNYEEREAVLKSEKKALNFVRAWALWCKKNKFGLYF